MEFESYVDLLEIEFYCELLQQEIKLQCKLAETEIKLIHSQSRFENIKHDTVRGQEK